MPRDIFHLTSAGSVDDGKSTILARLLLDTGSVYEDQLGGVDPTTVTATTIADLLDGLESEREQGITIDVAHRFFDSPTRRYHIADSPGHEQYTRNMATAASHANALLLVVDARVGPKPQTLTHLRIAYKLGIRHVIVAINKMDLVDKGKQVFSHRLEEVNDMMANYADISPVVIPVSGLTGANIVHRGKTASWWEGPTVLEALDQLTLPSPSESEPTVAIQFVQKSGTGHRQYLGSLVTGSLSDGDTLIVPTSARQVTISQLFYSGEKTDTVHGPTEIALTLKEDVDLARGDLISASSMLSVTDHIDCELVWLSDPPGVIGRTYELKIAHKTLRGTFLKATEILDENNTPGANTRELVANGVFRTQVSLSEKIAVAPFGVFSELGRLVVIDPGSGDTVGAATIRHSMRRGENISPFDFDVSAQQHSNLTGQDGLVFWFTGLSGSGKSTIANALSRRLYEAHIPHTNLDGDSLRRGLNKDLGFTESDRVENIRRTAEVAALMADAGLVVIVSLISPFERDRQTAKDIIGPNRFREIFVNTPLDVCEERDPKGLYKKARAGLIPNFTGVNQPYEPPTRPDLELEPNTSISIAVRKILRLGKLASSAHKPYS